MGGRADLEIIPTIKFPNPDFPPHSLRRISVHCNLRVKRTRPTAVDLLGWTIDSLSVYGCPVLFCSRLGSRTVLFFDLLKMGQGRSWPILFRLEERQRACEKIWRHFIFWRTLKISEKFPKFWSERPFFSLPRGLLDPWPRAFLSLASREPVLEKVVLGLGLRFFLCSRPPSLRPRLHLWSAPTQNIQVHSFILFLFLTTITIANAW